MGGVNFLKGGIYNATCITTVSPTYAGKIQQPDLGCRLHRVLRFRAADLRGITNGIDADSWNPRKDPTLAAPYTETDLSGKAACSERMQMEFDLEIDGHTLILGVVSRLYAQKGLATRYPGRIGSHVGFSERKAREIYSGCDVFVMPSRYEPCGLSQMYAMRYGSPPLVRSTGGLADTVEPLDEAAGAGTGFVFREPSVDDLAVALASACALFFRRPDEFRALQMRGMGVDFSWRVPAERYEEIFRRAIEAHSP